MQCNSCGGGGTGVPIALKIRSDEGTSSSSNRGYRIDRMRSTRTRGIAAEAVSAKSAALRASGITSIRTDDQHLGPATKTVARPTPSRTMSRK
jgi:hypothetical protein